MVIDVVTYNGEKELFDLRYNMLKECVDEFIVIEANKTFSGTDKPYLFELLPVRPKVTYFKTDEGLWEKYRRLAESSPQTRGAKHWVMEFMQKEAIKDALTHLKDEDTVLTGDVDEIWDDVVLRMNIMWPTKLKLLVYTYWLNNRSNEQFWGSIIAKYKDIKNSNLNHLRTTAVRTGTEWGWHFTSMGGAQKVREKLLDSYTQETYASDEILRNLAYNMDNDKDFLGRDFTYKVDESEWPQYLKDHRNEYQNLCKPSPK